MYAAARLMRYEMENENQPIRVLHVVTSMDRGGLETMLMNYYRHIDRSLVQFDFLTHRTEKAAYDDEIESLGGKLYHMPRLVPWSRSYRNAMDSFFLEHPEYRIVHVHQDCLSSVALQEAKKCGVPVRIAHSHSSNQNRDVKYPIKMIYMHKISKYATSLIACSQKAGNWMFSGAPFEILPNAIDVTAFKFDLEKRKNLRNKLNISEHTVLLGHVGRFMPEKNHTFLLDIFAEVAQMEPDARLMLVGDGKLRSAIEKKAKHMGLDRKVIFTGVRSDIQDLLQAMDVFVLPSLYEGLAVTLVEAQAAGLPCVISDNVTDECRVTTGLVTKLSLSDTTRRWAEHILTLRSTPRTDRCDEVKASGYDIKTGAKKLEQFYLEKARDV